MLEKKDICKIGGKWNPYGVQRTPLLPLTAASCILN
jgi:hypothetical protein